MNVNITITHTLAPEVVDILKNFSRGVDPLQPVAVAEAPKVVKQTKKELAAVTSAPAELENKPVVTEDLNITTEQVRAKTAEVIQSGKRAEVAKLLTEFGVAKLTELPKEQFASFYKQVAEL